MCNKGTPSQTTQQQTGGSATSQTQGLNVVGPPSQTLTAYQNFLNQALGLSQTPFNPATTPQVAPWTNALDATINQQVQTGMGGMQFVPQAASLLGTAGQSTIPQIGALASSLTNPYAAQAAAYGQQMGQQAANWAQNYGQQAAGWGTGQGQAIGQYGTGTGADIAAYARSMQQAAPQFQQFSPGAVNQYLSPYTQDVVNATQNQFSNANAIQGNALLGQGIAAGNAFGGDRAGIAAAQLANQQQLAQAPVIAGLYNQGYAQALQEYNTQNQLAQQMAQLGLQGQIAGGQLGLQGLTAGGQLGLQGLLGGGNLGMQGLLGGGALGLQGLGLGQQGAIAGTGQAISALGANQQAAQAAGQGFGQLGATQLGANLGGGQMAIGAAGNYQQYLQQLLNASQQGALMQSAYPFQQATWYGSLLGGLGPLTGTQQITSTQGQQQQQGFGAGTTTPPQPNQFVQLAGLGLAALPLLGLRRGGPVPRLQQGGALEPYGEPGGSMAKRLGYLPQVHMPIRSPTVLPAISASMGSPSNLLPNLGSLTGGNVPTTSQIQNSGTLGQIGSLLGNKQVQSGIQGLIGSPTTTIGNAPAPSVGLFSKRGGAIGHYQDGNTVPLPQPRPEEADTTDDDGQEPAGLPELADKPEEPAQEDVADTTSGGGPTQDLTETPPAAPPTQGQMPVGGLDFQPGRQWMQQVPQQPRSVGQMLQTIGLGMMSNPGAGPGGWLTGIGTGLAAEARQSAIDKQYKIGDMGGEQVIKYGDGRILHLGVPSAEGFREQRIAAKPVSAGGVSYVWNPKTRRYDPATSAMTSSASPLEVTKEITTEGTSMSFAPGGDRPTVDPPDPSAVGSTTSAGVKLAAEQYLQTGRLPPGLYRDKELRSAIMSYGAALAESRGLNPRQVVEMWRFAPRQAGWIMGQDGRTAGSLGTLIDHLDTMRDLTNALQNGDNQTYNYIKNKVAKWTGKSYPTNVEAGAEIVGAEIMKAIGAAGAGTGAERSAAGLNIGDLRKSPAQFAGNIDVVQRLAAGQLRTKYRQAEAIGLPKERLEALVGKRATEVLNNLDTIPAQQPAGAGVKTGPTGQWTPPAGSMRNKKTGIIRTPDGKLFNPDGTPVQ